MGFLKRHRALVFLPTAILIAALLGCSGSGENKAQLHTVSTSAHSPTAVSPTQGRLLGDLDDDGEASVGDAIRILRMVVGLDPDDECADANLNGTTDVGDAIKVLRCVVGLDTWPIGGGAATIGPAGGTLTSRDGVVSLDIPAGALQTEIAFTVSPQSTYPSDDNLVPRTCYDFAPDGTQFAQQAQLTVIYDETAVPDGALETGLALHKVGAAAWEPVADSAVDTDANTVSAPLGSLSTYAVLSDDETNGSDGQKLVWVKSGSFMMGSDDGLLPEQPVHQVKLDGFWIGRCEVTNDHYAAFLNEVKPADVSEWLDMGDPNSNIEYVKAKYQAKEALGQHPVVKVTWHGAVAYCAHYGYALPTEAQWEYTARGPFARIYPWGDIWNANNCCNNENKGPFGTTYDVGSLPAGTSWCLAMNMAGNVTEWCADWYGQDYYATSPDHNPTGPAFGNERVLRGSSWANGYYVLFSRGAARAGNPPDNSYADVGFRVSRSRP